MPRPTKHEQWRKAIGRKVTKLSPEVVQKLKQAFAVGATVKQACYYAEISERTYHNWCKKYPVLLREFNQMKERMPLKAKQNIAEALENKDLNSSWKLLEKREKDEYGERVAVEHSGEVKGGLPEEDKEIAKQFHESLKQNRLKRSKKKAEEDGEA